MDEFLNELYGTRETIGDSQDLEKQAASEFLVKLAEEEGVNLDELSDDQIGKLLEEVEAGKSSGESDKSKAEAEKSKAEEEKPKQASIQYDDEAQEKLAEADFLGRAMAHAYVNELAGIEKEAAIGPQISAARLGYRRLADVVGRRASQGATKARAGAKVVGEATGLSDVGGGMKKALQGLKDRAAKAKDIKRDYGTAGLKNLMGSRGEAAGEGLKQMGTGAARFGKRVAGPAAALEAVRRMGKAQGGSEKNSFDEEFESFAQDRALEMLEEAGYDVEKIAEAEIAQAIEARALDMIEEAGYPVER